MDTENQNKRDLARRMADFIKKNPEVLKYKDLSEAVNRAQRPGRLNVRKPSDIKLKLNITVDKNSTAVKSKSFSPSFPPNLINLLPKKRRDTFFLLSDLVRIWIDMGWTFENCVEEALFQNKALKIKPDLLKTIVKGIYKHNVISFTINIRQEDWATFGTYVMQDLDDFGDQLKRQVINIRKKEEEKRKPPGINRASSDFIKKLKRDAASLCALFSELRDIPVHDWPSKCKQLVEKYQCDGRYFEKRGKIDPELLSAYCLSKAYPEEMKEFNKENIFDIMAQNFNSKNLQQTFTLKNKRQKEKIEEIRKYIKDKLSKAVEKGNAEYLTKKGRNYPLIYTDFLAERDDMVPCDKRGRIIKPEPCHTKTKDIFENVVINSPYDFFILKIL